MFYISLSLDKLNWLDLLANLRVESIGPLKLFAGGPQIISKFQFHLLATIQEIKRTLHSVNAIRST
jgi:hypothetical protein